MTGNGAGKPPRRCGRENHSRAVRVGGPESEAIQSVLPGRVAGIFWCRAPRSPSGQPAAIGSTQLSLGQLKILQEAITLSVFVPFAVFSMRQPLKLDYPWAALCIGGAVFFMFREG